MKTGWFNARHRGTVGPGGWFCTCCGPAPKYRRMFARLHKKRMQRVFDRLEKEGKESTK